MERFTSVFTEPGVVGTTSAFMLASSNMDFKKDKRNIVLFISGFLSQSVAFIVLVVMYYIVQGLAKRSFKSLGTIVLIVMIYVVFMNTNFHNESVSALQQRLVFTEEGLAGDNRIKEYAQLEYEDFLHGDLITVLFGYGNAYENPTTNLNFWQGSATYKRQVFQFGIIGFGIYLLWIIFIPFSCFKTDDKDTNVKIYIYILVFIASMYQRPQITTLFFLYFLIAGCVYVKKINIKLLKNVESNKNVEVNS